MLIFDNITLDVAGRNLIKNATINIIPKTNVGLVGHNGTGKSTLLKAIIGEIPLIDGEITYPKNCKIGWVEQEVEHQNIPIIDILLKKDVERTQLLAQLETENDPIKIANIHERLNDIDAYSAPARAKSILYGLGFDEHDQAQTVTQFSGGMRMRIALAGALFSNPDLLLLDEPSNYLDFEGVAWLESYIRKFDGTILLISHNRDLLNNCTDYTLSLEHHSLNLWRGNYDQYLKQRSEKLTFAQKQAKVQEKKRKKIMAFVERFKAKPTKARQAQSRLKMLEKMETIELYNDENVAPFHFLKTKNDLASPLIKLENIILGYNDNIVLKDLNLRIDNDDRIALLGKNGNGKSTFAKFLAHKLKEMKGERVEHSKLQIAYFEQHNVNSLIAEQTPIEHIRKIFPELNEAKTRSILANWGIDTQKATTKTQNLSGGEKARLAMCLSCVKGADLLILDEPTNHLDIDSRQELISALNDFNGAVIIISHDQYMLQATCDTIWQVANHTIIPYKQNIEQYKLDIAQERTKSENKKLVKSDNKTSKKDIRKKNAEKRSNLSDLKKQINKAESDIKKYSKKYDQITTELMDPKTYQKPSDYINNLNKEKNIVEQKLKKAEQSWLKYSEIYEQAYNSQEE